MKNKVVIYVLCVLIIIFLCLGIFGIFNKNNGGGKSNTIVPNNEPSYEKISFNGSQHEIESFDNVINSFEFIRANKEYESGAVKVYIDGSNVKVDVQKSAIPGVDENTPDIINYVIEDIDSPVAVCALMSKYEGNRINVYTLDSNGKLYLSTFNAAPYYYSKIDTYIIDVDNVESFVSSFSPLVGQEDTYYNYVIFKTNDGVYYTDYRFDERDELIISRITGVQQ